MNWRSRSRARGGRVSISALKNNSLWATKTGNSGLTESVTCDRGKSGVFGQPLPRASALRSPNFPERDFGTTFGPGLQCGSLLNYCQLRLNCGALQITSTMMSDEDVRSALRGIEKANSFVAQNDHWIDLRRAMSGEVGG